VGDWVAGTDSLNLTDNGGLKLSACRTEVPALDRELAQLEVAAPGRAAA
jgi:hypothetical protein